VLNGSEVDAPLRIKELTGRVGADVSIEITGQYGAIHDAIRATAYNSRVVVSGFFHLIQIGSQVALARALGLPIDAGFFLVVVPIVNILAMLPVSFSGIGVREAAYLYFLTQLGVERESAIALGLLGSVIVLVTGLSGVPFFLLLRSGGKVEAADVVKVEETL